jgi:hypothetical protein
MKRFWDKVKIAGPKDCWEWTAAKDKNGYGFFRFDDKQQKAHRVAWQLEIGPIPDEMHICHVCDNPPCVNPNHLFLGTPKDNMQDKLAKGRHRWRNETHCKYGHEFNAENTTIECGRVRRCKVCRRIREQRYYARRKEQECQK